MDAEDKRRQKAQALEALREKKRRLLLQKPIYKPNAGQIQIHKSQALLRFVASGNGCWAPGTKVRMFDGSVKAVESVLVGDQLMGPDNKPRIVLKLYYGIEKMYKICPKWSDPYIVNESHVLSLKKRDKGNLNSAGEVEAIKVKDYIEALKEDKYCWTQWRPKRGIDYKDNPVVKRKSELFAAIDKHGWETGFYNIRHSNYKYIQRLREVVNSIGGRAQVITEELYGEKVYKLRISLKQEEEFKVKPLEIGEFYGFQVDKDSLLLLEDYTVQHNSGKTTSVVHEAYWCANGNHPYREMPSLPTKTVVVLDHPDKVADKYLPEFRKWYNLDEEAELKQDGRPYVTRIVWKNGSVTKFRFHEQPEMVFESTEADFYLFDEPPPRHIYVACRRGGRLKGRKAWYLIVGTPISQPWLRREIVEPWQRGELEDAECFRWHSNVNEDNLAEGYLKEFTSVLSEREKQIRLEGRFFDLSGLALQHLIDENHHYVDPWPWANGWPCVVAVDPHPNKSNTAILLGCTPDEELYVIDELSSPSDPYEFARELSDMMEDKRIVDIICDSFGSAATTGGDGRMSFIDKLNETWYQMGKRYRARATTYNEKSDEAFIQTIRNVLKIEQKGPNKSPSSKLKVFKSCRGTIADIENVSWSKHKGLDEYKPKLDIQNKDFLACLKYALSKNLIFSRARAKVYKRNPITAYGQRSGKRI